MAFKPVAIALTTSDQDALVCGAGLENIIHGLTFGNSTGSARVVTVKYRSYTLATTFTLGTVAVPANSTGRWADKITLNPGDKLILVADGGSAVTAFVAYLEQGGANPIATNFVGKGEYNSDTIYAVNDVTEAGGTSYLSLQAPNLNHAPASSPTYWMVLAGKGEPGDNTTATDVTFTPTGGIAATNVQTALAELDTEKATVASVSAITAGGLGALVASNNLSDLTNAGLARSSLGLVIGTNVLGISGGTLTGALTLNADPSSALHAATKQYVDAVAQGLDAKPSVRAATAVALATNTRSSNVLTASANGALTVDGVTVVLNDRVLVKNEATTANNGLYYMSQLGDGSNPWKLTRVTDMDAWAEVPGAYAFVEEGTANADTGWICTSNSGGTLNTTAVTWSIFTRAADYTASGGIALSTLNFTLDLNALTAKATPIGADSVAGVDSAASNASKKFLLSALPISTPTQTALDLKENLGEYSAVNTQTGSYTLVLTDKSKFVEMNSGSALNLTVPPNSSVAFPTKSRIDFAQYGAGQVTVVAGSGVTIRSSGSKLKLTGQYSAGSLIKRGTDEWWLIGDIAA